MSFQNSVCYCVFFGMAAMPIRLFLYGLVTGDYNKVRLLTFSGISLRWTYIIFIISLRAKRVGDFIEIRHKKISPTCILSSLGCLFAAQTDKTHAPKHIHAHGTSQPCTSTSNISGQTPICTPFLCPNFVFFPWPTPTQNLCSTRKKKESQKRNKDRKEIHTNK